MPKRKVKTEHPEILHEAHDFLRKFFRVFGEQPSENDTHSEIIRKCISDFSAALDAIPTAARPMRSISDNLLLKFVEERERSSSRSRRTQKSSRSHAPLATACMSWMDMDPSRNSAPAVHLKEEPELSVETQVSEGYTTWGNVCADRSSPREEASLTEQTESSENAPRLSIDAIFRESPQRPPRKEKVSRLKAGAQSAKSKKEVDIPSDSSFADLIGKFKVEKSSREAPADDIDCVSAKASSPESASDEDANFQWKSIRHVPSVAYTGISSTPPGMWSLGFSQPDE